MQTPRRLLRVVAWIAVTAFGTTNVLAAPIDLATSPLVTGLGKNVAPNVFFILDDSASMPLEYMPDAVNTGSGYQNRACYRNFGYNTLYYNPSTTYTPPLGNDGLTQKPNASFTGAWVDGFDTGAGTTDLSATTAVNGTITVGPVKIPNSAASATNPFAITTNGQRTITVTHTGNGLPSGPTITVRFTGATGTLNSVNLSNLNNRDLTVTNLSTNTYRVTLPNNVGNAATGTSGTGGGNNVFATYTYTGVVRTDSNFYYYSYTGNPASPPGTCESDGSYTRVPALGSSWSSMNAAQRTNFANWYSYYRTRLLMMKTASGRAFSPLTDKYRVGFTVTSEKGTAAGKFLGVKKFDTSQRTAWYTALNGILDDDTFAGTPLRGALSKAGRYFAGTLSNALAGSDADPVQYSCQQNFAILATDGFWNTSGEASSGTRYGAYREDNSTLVGDQDSGTGALTPYRDGRSGTTNIVRQNTLADVAMYYYKTDLRPTAGANGGLTDDNTHIDVSTDNVPTSNTDTASHQHMTTYTMGLGVSDQLAYPGDYANILSGSKNWPDPNVTNTATTVAGRVDDLWHAAINGRGLYLSAKDPGTVVSELSKALQSIRAVLGSSSAAATSNLQPIAGDNTAFIAQYKTVAWTGDLVARTIDVTTGVIPATSVWSAQAKLNSLPLASRKIYTFSSSSGTYGHRRDFTVANLTSAPGLNYFRADGTNPGGALPQYAGWTTDQRNAGTPAAMIDYLRGVRTNEGDGTGTTQLFRVRENLLGDIVSAAPVFVRKPPFAYTDAGYSTFLSSTAIQNRLPTVYVGANDGMLHAFNGSAVLSNGTVDPDGGKERWAYVPGLVLKDLYKLGASDYSLNHRFYVDGPIAVGDARNSVTETWSTILVGGLGGGGKGYYALDVTDPAAPKVLWEFGTTADYPGDLSYDANMGYSYGNPIITKLDDGDGDPANDKWVVLFASGYNNSSGDRRGHLFVVDAFTGAKISGTGDIATTTTANEELSGIARISNLVENNGLRNNVTRYVYGGDLNGSLWRFDIQAGTALKLADTSSTPGAQPITVQPELARIRTGVNTYTAIYFGTGRYLGPNDLSEAAPSSTVAQGIYAVKDTGTYLGVLTNTSSGLVSQTLNASTNPRTSTSNTVNWSSNNGWYLTTPANSGERFTIDPGLQLGTLIVAGNIPKTDYCQPTGSSILYQLSYLDGKVLTTNTFASQVVGNTQVLLGGSDGQGGDGGNTVQGGKPVIITVLASGESMTVDQEKNPTAGSGARRISWREIE